MPRMFAGSAMATLSFSPSNATGTATTRRRVRSGISSPRRSGSGCPRTRGRAGRDGARATARPPKPLRRPRRAAPARASRFRRARALPRAGRAVTRSVSSTSSATRSAIVSKPPCVPAGPRRRSRSSPEVCGRAQRRRQRLELHGVLTARSAEDPRYQSRIGSPAKSATRAPKARNGANGERHLACARPVPERQDRRPGRARTAGPA